jgi:hypothetical protein
MLHGGGEGRLAVKPHVGALYAAPAAIISGLGREGTVRHRAQESVLLVTPANQQRKAR